MNHTTNYQLSQWEAGDKVQRTDFNADNAKIDAAIKAVDVKVDTLDGRKADTSALDALSQLVSGHTSALNKKGNCQICFKTYTGTGVSGNTGPTVLTFPGKPLLVVISDLSLAYTVMTVQGDSTAVCRDITSASPLNVSWSGNSLSLIGVSASVQMNGQNSRYAAVALIATDG